MFLNLCSFVLQMRKESAFYPQTFGSGNAEYIPPSSVGEQRGVFNALNLVSLHTDSLFSFIIFLRVFFLGGGLVGFCVGFVLVWFFVEWPTTVRWDCSCQILLYC